MYSLLMEALRGYVKSAQLIKARPNILNQKSDTEYENLWALAQKDQLMSKKEKENAPTVHSFGRMSLASA